MKVIFLIIICCLIASCSLFRDDENKDQRMYFSKNNSVKPQVKREYKGAKKRMTREDFIDKADEEGSLWHDVGQTNFYFIKNKVYHLGDVLTVNINEELRKEIISELKNSLTAEEKEADYLARLRLEKELEEKQKATSGGAKTTVSTAEKEAIKTDAEKEDEKLQQKQDIYAAEIIDTFQNGNYKIRGLKKVPYRGKQVTLEVVSMIGSKDINDLETIESEKLYETKVTILR